MRFDRVVLQHALGALIACRVLFIAGCAGAEPDDEETGASTIGAAAQGAAGEGVGDDGESEEGTAGERDAQADLADGSAARAPRFGEVYEIFAGSCGGGEHGCHVTGMAAGLLLPDAAAAHAALVSVPSSKCADELLVAPGDADHSVLVTVLDGGAECVKPMPLGRDPLSADQIALVRAWIDAGAVE